MGSLPAGYMWVNGQIYEVGGRKLTATESRFLLLSDAVANPNHLRRGSVRQAPSRLQPQTHVQTVDVQIQAQTLKADFTVAPLPKAS